MLAESMYSRIMYKHWKILIDNFILQFLTRACRILVFMDHVHKLESRSCATVIRGTQDKHVIQVTNLLSF